MKGNAFHNNSAGMNGTRFHSLYHTLLGWNRVPLSLSHFAGMNETGFHFLAKMKYIHRYRRRTFTSRYISLVFF